MQTVVFSGAKKFMEKNMDIFERDGVKVLSKNDNGEDIYGTKLLEVTVEAEQNDIDEMLNRFDDRDNNGQFGGAMNI